MTRRKGEERRMRDREKGDKILSDDKLKLVVGMN